MIRRPTSTRALAPPTPEIADAAGIPGVVSPLNFANYFNGDAFGAAVAATKTDVFEERYALYESIMLTIAEEVPIWYSGHTATAFGIDPSVTGLNGWHLPSGELGAGHSCGRRPLPRGLDRSRLRLIGRGWKGFSGPSTPDCCSPLFPE